MLEECPQASQKETKPVAGVQEFESPSPEHDPGSAQEEGSVGQKSSSSLSANERETLLLSKDVPTAGNTGTPKSMNERLQRNDAPSSDKSGLSRPTKNCLMVDKIEQIYNKRDVEAKELAEQLSKQFEDPKDIHAIRHFLVKEKAADYKFFEKEDYKSFEKEKEPY